MGYVSFREGIYSIWDVDSEVGTLTFPKAFGKKCLIFKWETKKGSCLGWQLSFPDPPISLVVAIVLSTAVVFPMFWNPQGKPGLVHHETRD